MEFQNARQSVSLYIYIAEYIYIYLFISDPSLNQSLSVVMARAALGTRAFANLQHS